MVKTDEGVTAQGERMLTFIRTKYPQYHPLMAIAEMAHDAGIEDHKLKLECHKTILRHVSPELKSIEVKADIKESRRVIVSMFDDGASGNVYENNSGKPVVAKEEDPLWLKLIADSELQEEAA